MKTNKKAQKTAIIYARQSYGREENALSPEQQIIRCREWAKNNSVEVIGVYRDNNASSELYPDSELGRAYCSLDIAWQIWRRSERTFRNRKPYRKGLAEAFDAIQKNKVDFFIVDDVTRFYRNPSATAQLDNYCLSILQENHTALVKVTENHIDYLTNNIEITIRKAFAQFEAQIMNDKARHSRENRLANIRQGIVYSNAYGVEWKKRKICFNSEKREAIRYIFESVIGGKTYAEIIYTLNTTYRKCADGKCFYETSVYNAIRNPIYCGFKKLGDGEMIQIKNMGDAPIITYREWQEANKIVADKKKRSGKQKYNVRNAERRHFLPFSGILKCGNCGSRLHMVDDGGICYFCKHTILEKNKKCTPSRIRFCMEWDDNDFLLVFQPLFKIRLYSYLIDAERIKNTKEKENQLIAEIDSLNARIRTITDIFLKNELDTDLFKEQIETAKAKIVEKKNELLSIQSFSAAEEDKWLERYRILTEQVEWAEKLMDHDIYSKLLRETIKEVVVYAERIKVGLFDGNCFELPRIKGHRRSKKLPISTSHGKLIKGTHYIKNYITFECDTNENEKILLDTDTYQIILKY